MAVSECFHIFCFNSTFLCQEPQIERWTLPVQFGLRAVSVNLLPFISWTRQSEIFRYNLISGICFWLFVHIKTSLMLLSQTRDNEEDNSRGALSGCTFLLQRWVIVKIFFWYRSFTNYNGEILISSDLSE